MKAIHQYLDQNRRSLFEAYTAMDDAVRTWDNSNAPWTEKKTPSRKLPGFEPGKPMVQNLNEFTPAQQTAINELRAARELRSIKDARVAAQAEEENHFAQAKLNGQVVECGCCFDEFPADRVVECNGEVTHLFCRGCMRSQAETNIGVSKHELTCMSMDGCQGGFSLSQRNLFLDNKLRNALDKIEVEASLREANIEGLETCPFCPYAAECPLPADVDKEFRCQNPKCETVSCRLCRKKTHIPKSCVEASADDGLDARHVLEEAMSAALIRKCNNCKMSMFPRDSMCLLDLQLTL